MKTDYEIIRDMLMRRAPFKQQAIGPGRGERKVIPEYHAEPDGGKAIRIVDGAWSYVSELSFDAGGALIGIAAWDW
jgi:hypothetical protein